MSTHYNLESLLERLFRSMDHAPNSTPEGLARAKDALNIALVDMTRKVPFLFNKIDIRCVFEPDVVPLDATDLITTTADAWVLELVLPAGTTDASGNLIAQPWEDNREWGGRTLLVEDEDTEGLWHEFQIREVWSTVGTIRVSLDRPWTFGAVAGDGLKWRVITSQTMLPPTISSISHAKLYGENNLRRDLEIVNQHDYEYLRLHSQQDISGGAIPRRVFERPSEMLRAPNFTPVLDATNDLVPWVASSIEMPKGQIQLMFTYVYGKQDAWLGLPGPSQANAAGAVSDRYLPWLESGPSKPSDPVQIGTYGVTMTLPNFDRMVGFEDAANLRYRRAGIRKRIYVRYLTVDDPTWELSDRWFPVAEVDGHETSYTFNGSDLADMLSPLRSTTQARTIGLYPTPDKRYVAHFRAVEVPEQLVDDTDIAPVPTEGLAALLARARAHIYHASGNASMEGLELQAFEQKLSELRGSYFHRGTPKQRRLARARAGRNKHYVSPVDIMDARLDYLPWTS